MSAEEGARPEKSARSLQHLGPDGVLGGLLSSTNTMHICDQLSLSGRLEQRHENQQKMYLFKEPIGFFPLCSLQAALADSEDETETPKVKMLGRKTFLGMSTSMPESKDMFSVGLGGVLTFMPS